MVSREPLCDGTRLGGTREYARFSIQSPWIPGGRRVAATAPTISSACSEMLNRALVLIGVVFAYDSTHRRIIVAVLPTDSGALALGAPAPPPYELEYGTVRPRASTGMTNARPAGRIGPRQ